MAIVILFEREGLRQCGAGDEDRADPVMNEPAGDVYRLTVVERFEPLDHNFPFF